MRIGTRQFSGEQPKLNTRLRGPSVAEVAKDVNLVSGSLRPRYSNRLIEEIAQTDALTLFETDGKFFSWANDVDAVETPVDALAGRLFYTGDGLPKQTTTQGVFEGVVDRMGVPAPLQNPLAVTYEPVAPTTDTIIDGVWVITYTNRWGEEGSISNPLEFPYRNGDLLTIRGGRGLNTDLDDYGIVSWNLYRLVGDDTQRVAIIPIDVQDYVDDTSSITQDTLSSLLNYPPPVNMIGLHVMSNGIALGFVKGSRTVNVSEPYNLNAWAYEFTVESEVVAISSFDNTAVIGTKGYPEIATIINPQSIVPVRLNDREPCVAKRGMVQGNGGVYYPAPSGLFFIAPGVTRLVTQDVMDKRDWVLLQPTTFTSVFRNGQYIGFHGDVETGGAWIMDYREGNVVISRSSLWASAMTVAEGRDDMYFQIGRAIYLYQGGVDFTPYEWESSVHGDGSPYALTTRRVLSHDLNQNPTPTELAAIRVVENDALTARNALRATFIARPISKGLGGAVGQSPVGVSIPVAGHLYGYLDDALELAYVDLKVFADGALMHEERIEYEDVDRINYHDRARYWHYVLGGTAEVTQFDLAGSGSELHSGS